MRNTQATENILCETRLWLRSTNISATVDISWFRHVVSHSLMAGMDVGGIISWGH